MRKLFIVLGLVVACSHQGEAKLPTQASRASIGVSATTESRAPSTENNAEALPRGRTIEQLLTESVTSMVRSQGALVVLTEDWRILRFSERRWERVDPTDDFLQRRQDRTGRKILDITLLPGVARDPLVALITAMGEDATTAMDSTTLELFSVSPKGWVELPLPQTSLVIQPNADVLHGTKDGEPAVCSRGGSNAFCLIHDREGWYYADTTALGSLDDVKWVAQKLQGLTSHRLVMLDGRGATEVGAPITPDSSPSLDSFLGSSEDFWAAADESILRNQRTIKSPIGAIRTIWGSVDGEAWFGGAEGLAFANGNDLRVVPGGLGSIDTIIGDSPNELWFGGRSGVYHTVPATQAVRLLPRPVEIPDIVAATVEPIGFGTKLPLKGKVVTLTNPGGLPLRDALFVDTVAPSDLAFAGFEGIYTYALDAPTAKRVVSVSGNRIPMGASRVGNAPLRCMPPMSEPSMSWAFSLGRQTRTVEARLTAALNPILLYCRGNQFVRAPLVEITVGDFTVAESEHVWIAGSEPSETPTSSTTVGPPLERTLPEQSGTLLDWYDGRMVLYTVNDTPLYAVSASQDTIWTAGAAGIVGRVQGEDYRLFELEPKRAYWDILADEGGVWLVGEGDEVVYFDGENQTTYRHPGLRGPLTGLARDARGRLWIVGPNVIFLVTSQ